MIISVVLHCGDAVEILYLSVAKEALNDAKQAITVGHNTWQLAGDEKTVEEHIEDALREAGVQYEILDWNSIEQIDLQCD